MAVTFFQTVQSFAQFLLNWTLTGGKMVDQNTANIRASICIGCHANVPSKEVKKGGCSSCNKMGGIVLNSIRSKIIGGNKTTSDSRLLTCMICGCDNRISVWIPNQVLVDSMHDVNAFPTHCWKKKLAEGSEV